MNRTSGETRRGRAASGLGARVRRAVAVLLAALASGCAAIDAPPAPSVGSFAPAAAPQTTGGAADQPRAQAPDRRLRRRIQRACDRALSQRDSGASGAGERDADRNLPRDDPQFARRQRLRASLGRHFRHPRPARARQRRLGGRRGDGARNRARDRASRRPARRTRTDRRAVHPRVLAGSRSSAGGSGRSRRG